MLSTIPLYIQQDSIRCLNGPGTVLGAGFRCQHQGLRAREKAEVGAAQGDICLAAPLQHLGSTIYIKCSTNGTPTPTPFTSLAPRPSPLNHAACRLVWSLLQVSGEGPSNSLGS